MYQDDGTPNERDAAGMEAVVFTREQFNAVIDAWYRTAAVELREVSDFLQFLDAYTETFSTFEPMRTWAEERLISAFGNGEG